MVDEKSGPAGFVPSKKPAKEVRNNVSGNVIRRMPLRAKSLKMRGNLVVGTKLLSHAMYPYCGSS